MHKYGLYRLNFFKLYVLNEWKKIVDSKKKECRKIFYLYRLIIIIIQKCDI